MDDDVNQSTTIGFLDDAVDLNRIEDLVEYWTNGVVTTVIVLTGLVANSLTLAVLHQHSTFTSTQCYLSTLAVWDSIVLISTGLLIGLPVLSKHYNDLVYPYVVSYIYPLALVAQTATIWLTVAFTTERYIAVCHPLRASGFGAIFVAKKVIIAVSMFAFLYNLPRWFEFRPLTEFGDDNVTLSVKLTRTQFGLDTTYLLVYYSYLYLPFMCFLPVLILCTLNAFLILAVRRASVDRQRMNVKMSSENNVTVMLVAVVMVFIVCQVPALVYNFAYALDSDATTRMFEYRMLSHARNFLVNLNSAVNFLLYCAFGRTFRRIFLETFCHGCISGQRTTGSGGIGAVGGPARSNVTVAGRYHYVPSKMLVVGKSSPTDRSPCSNHRWVAGNNVREGGHEKNQAQHSLQVKHSSD